MISLLLALLAAGPPVQWTWSGIELIGCRRTPREAVLRDAPVTVGEPFEFDPAALGEWSRRVRERCGLASVEAGVVRYADGGAYLVVDVVEFGDEARASFRPAPRGDHPLPVALQARYAALERRMYALFEQGRPSPERVAPGGWLTYDDPAMAELAQELSEACPPAREAILATLLGDADAARRATAAHLLNWAGDPESNVAAAIPAVDDPDGTVRNNISRFLLHFVDRLSVEATRRALIAALARQLERPSHGDRDKAVFSLLFLARARPGDRPAIRCVAAGSLAWLASASVLSNVAGPARELLDLLPTAPRAEAWRKRTG